MNEIMYVSDLLKTHNETSNFSQLFEHFVLFTYLLISQFQFLIHSIKKN